MRRMRTWAESGIRPVALVLLSAGAFACAPSDDGAVEEPGGGEAAVAASFDGADYATETETLAHGERVSRVLGCNSCHLEDYTGADFGEMIPLVDGLWATNITRTMPEMSDAELERLLREGVHPRREIYLMPSKQSQFLSDRDMNALIAFLRTLEPSGEPTPVPPPGFEEAVTARLPEDYWLTNEEGAPRNYHNAAEEVAWFAENAPPELGEGTAQGRLVALTVCTACHGAALDGVGEPAGDIAPAREYADDQLVRLLLEGIRRDGQPIEMNWGSGHVPAELTESEIQAVVAYVRRLVDERGTL